MTAECDYTILCDGELGFLMSSLKEKLEQKNILVERCDINMRNLGNLTKLPYIFIVDDSPVFLRTISDWLEDTYIVNICPSATAAFHMMEVNKPDLILLDYEMPICSGAKFLEMLRSEPSSASIPVIFLTSRGDEATVRKVLSLNPQGYLLKNLPKEDIIEAIGDFFIKLKAK